MFKIRKSNFTFNFDPDAAIRDWVELESYDCDFRFQMPQGWTVEREEKDGCPRVAYSGHEKGVAYIVQRVDYTSVVESTKFNVYIPDDVIRQLLQARMGEFVKVQKGRRANYRFVNYLGRESIEFNSRNDDTTMSGVIFWEDNKSYSIISLFDKRSLAQHSHFKNSFSIVEKA